MGIMGDSPSAGTPLEQHDEPLRLTISSPIQLPPVPIIQQVSRLVGGVGDSPPLGIRPEQLGVSPAAILLNARQLPSGPTTKQASRVEGTASTATAPKLRLLGPLAENIASTAAAPKLRPLAPRPGGTASIEPVSNLRPLALRVEGPASIAAASAQPAKRRGRSSRKKLAEEGTQSIVSLPSPRTSSQSVVPVQSVAGGS